MPSSGQRPGIHSRFVRAAYLAVDNAAERIAGTFGPFVDGDATLVEFRVVECRDPANGTAQRAEILDDIGNAVVMLLPAQTAADADAALRIFTIPAGTVLLPASLLVANAKGFAMFRIATGTLELAIAALNLAGGELLLRRDPEWQLTLQLEAAPPASADGSDGNAVAVALPSQLFVASDGHVSVSGGLGIRGSVTPCALIRRATCTAADRLRDPLSIRDGRGRLERGRRSFLARDVGRRGDGTAGLLGRSDHEGRDRRLCRGGTRWVVRGPCCRVHCD